MSKTVCIYPQDATTDFLRPLCNHICATFDAVEVGYDTSGDDDEQKKIIFNEIKDAETIFFLGHGKSTCLYASVLEEDVELFNDNNISLLEGKRSFLLACNSDQFINKYKLKGSIGFGFLPTSLYEVRHRRKLHSMRIEHLRENDIDIYNIALVNSLSNTLSEATMDDFNLFRERMLFNICGEIVDCLTNKKSTNYRTVADELYYMYEDMVLT